MIPHNVKELAAASPFVVYLVMLKAKEKWGPFA